MNTPGHGISHGYIGDPRMTWLPAPTGQRVLGIQTALDSFAQTRPKYQGGSWSPVRYRDDIKSPSRFLSSCAIVVDVDFYAKGEHVAPPPASRQALLSLARKEKLGIVYETPRGLRVILPLAEDCTNRTQFLGTTEVAAEWIQGLLERAALGWTPGCGVAGFAADPRARPAYYLPNCMILDRARTASLFRLRSTPFPIEEILWHMWKPR